MSRGKSSVQEGHLTKAATGNVQGRQYSIIQEGKCRKSKFKGACLPGPSSAYNSVNSNIESLNLEIWV